MLLVSLVLLRAAIASHACHLSIPLTGMLHRAHRPLILGVAVVVAA